MEIELMDEVFVTERQHSVEGSKEVALVDLHQWTLIEEILLLGRLLLLESK